MLLILLEMRWGAGGFAFFLLLLGQDKTSLYAVLKALQRLYEICFLFCYHEERQSCLWFETSHMDGDFYCARCAC